MTDVHPSIRPGAWVAAATPEDVVERLAHAFARVMSSPESIRFSEQTGARIVAPATQAHNDGFFAAAIARHRRTAQAVKLEAR